MKIKRQRLEITWPALQAPAQTEPGLLVQFLPVKTSELVLEQDGAKGVAITAGVNHGGYALDPWGMTRAQSKILLLANHDHDTPLGEVTELTQSAEGIRFGSRFVEPEDKTTGWAERWADAMARYRQGMLPMASVGFVPNVQSVEMHEDGYPIFRQWALVEISLVAAGLDPGADLQRAPAAAPPGADAPPAGRLLVTFPNLTRK